MDSFSRDVITTVLSSTVNELLLLSHGKHLRSSTISKGEADKRIQTTPESEGTILPSETLNEIKLSNDLKKLIDVYLETIEELKTKGTIQKLLATISQQIETNKKEASLIDQHKASTSELKDITSKLSEFKSEADSKLLQASETLNNLKSDWRVISKINELEYELVRKWEYTRFTQATIVGEKDEDNLRRQKASFVNKTDTEQRCIIQSQSYAKEQFEKYFGLIEMWKEKYSKELNELQASIAEKENKIKDVNKTYEKHHEIYCKRKKFIEEYLEQKAEQNRLLELQTKRIDSAVKIQAWWRGLMVRRCLGPFRKKSKKGKKVKKVK